MVLLRENYRDATTGSVVLPLLPALDILVIALVPREYALLDLAEMTCKQNAQRSKP